jgi:hypothetical protein
VITPVRATSRLTQSPAHGHGQNLAAYEIGNTQADPTDIQLATFTP